jgi:hypothetical protein
LDQEFFSAFVSICVIRGFCSSLRLRVFTRKNPELHCLAMNADNQNEAPQQAHGCYWT